MEQKEIYAVGKSAGMTVQEYLAWLYNRDNICKCERCPDNEGFDAGISGSRFPCGQFHCWVAIHCRHARKED